MRTRLLTAISVLAFLVLLGLAVQQTYLASRREQPEQMQCHLRMLHDYLYTYSLAHNGYFPSDLQALAASPDLPPELRQLIEEGGIRYRLHYGGVVPVPQFGIDGYQGGFSSD